MTQIEDEPYDDRPGRFARLRGLVRPLLIGLAVIVLLYYPIGMLWLHEIDDDALFGLNDEAVPANASRSVAIATALIEREVVTHHWPANDPFFLPGAALDNMPNYQMGIISALARFAFELTDQIGRTRGSSQADRDLQEAAGLLQYPGDKWIFDFSTSLMPTVSSEAQYRRAMRALQSYNQRLANDQAVFERRADNLLATLERIAADLGSSSAALDRHIAERSGALLDFQVDDLFYNIKGQTYAYFMILRELRQDFSNVVNERELGPAWEQMLDSMRSAAVLSPGVVLNGSPDSQLVPSHLASLGFYVLRARTQLREIANILLK